MILILLWRNPLKTNNRSWGLQHLVLPPPPLGHPPITISSQKVDENILKIERRSGADPLGCINL
jgi:hypothetical protein